MTEQESAERAVDLLTTFTEPARQLVCGKAVPLAEPHLSDQIIDALNRDDALMVLASMTAIASVLLVSVSQSTGHSSESILLTVQKALA